MEARTIVNCVHVVKRKPRQFGFRVEVTCGAETFEVRVSAQELLDFDAFQTAALRQTGRLIMAPCCAGAEGPEHYRRIRGNWCRELRGARWESIVPGEPTAAAAPAAGVPAPKGLGSFVRKSV